MNIPFTPSSWWSTLALRSQSRKTEAPIRTMSAVHCHRVSRQNFRVVTCERARAGFGAAFTVLRFLISAGAADIEELPILQYCHKNPGRCFADHTPVGLLVDKKGGFIRKARENLSEGRWAARHHLSFRLLPPYVSHAGLQPH